MPGEVPVFAAKIKRANICSKKNDPADGVGRQTSCFADHLFECLSFIPKQGVGSFDKKREGHGATNHYSEPGLRCPGDDNREFHPTLQVCITTSHPWMEVQACTGHQARTAAHQGSGNLLSSVI